MFIPEVQPLESIFVGNVIHPTKAADLIDSCIQEKYGTNVIAVKSDVLARDDFTINGSFNYQCWNHQNNITLELVYSSNIINGWIFHEGGWDNLQFMLYQALVHELIHRSQYKKRNGLRHYHDGYFDHPDEIQAYAHTAASEFLFNGHSVDEALQRLRNYYSVSEADSITFSRLLLYFTARQKDKALRTFLKRTIKYLEDERD